MADNQIWVCVPCSWFAYEDALKKQEEWGVQKEDNWCCPGCGRQLTKEVKDGS